MKFRNEVNITLDFLIKNQVVLASTEMLRRYKNAGIQNKKTDRFRYVISA
jgi:hypothetical protein